MYRFLSEILLSILFPRSKNVQSGVFQTKLAQVNVHTLDEGIMERFQSCLLRLDIRLTIEMA